MTLLSPLGLLWLGAVPILLWLWRLASSARQTRVASLIPFEHLLKRTSRRRRRLVINWLFWLQLLALIAAALALAQPALHMTRAKTILAILDTSASMAAHQGGSTPFDRARRAVLTQLARKSPADQVLLLATAPVMPLWPEPTSDDATLARAVDAQRVQPLDGSLSTAQRLGRALLGRSPDETWVVTDEPPPPRLAPTVRWMSVGQPLPNQAIVGVDAVGPLCDPSDARVVVTVQSFSGTSARVRLTARQEGRLLAERDAELAPRSRQSLAMPLPAGTSGVIELALAGAPDALAVDNRAWVTIQPTARLPIVVRAGASATQTLSRWLGACKALAWSADPSAPAGPHLLITDREGEGYAASGSALVLRPPAEARPIYSHWMVSPDHPIGAYLSPVGVVVAPLNTREAGVLRGTPVVSAFVEGRKIPIVVADEREGRRVVELRFNLTGQEASTPVALVFFNSLRWLIGDRQPTTTRDPFVVDGWAPGLVTVQSLDRSSRQVPSIGGRVRDETATQPGVYRLTQGSRSVIQAVNFLDPLESNTLDRISTWSGSGVEETAADGARASAEARMPARAPPHPLAPSIMLALLLLLVAEWWVYSSKQSALRAPGSGLRARPVAHSPEATAPSHVGARV